MIQPKKKKKANQPKKLYKFTKHHLSYRSDQYLSRARLFNHKKKSLWKENTGVTARFYIHNLASLFVFIRIQTHKFKLSMTPRWWGWYRRPERSKMELRVFLWKGNFCSQLENGLQLLFLVADPQTLTVNDVHNGGTHVLQILASFLYSGDKQRHVVYFNVNGHLEISQHGEMIGFSMASCGW